MNTGKSYIGMNLVALAMSREAHSTEHLLGAIMSDQRKPHPWSQPMVKKVKGEPDDNPGTSAYWTGSWLWMIGVGKPYADWVEWQARLDGRLIGDRWVGENAPEGLVNQLKRLGRIK